MPANDDALIVSMKKRKSGTHSSLPPHSGVIDDCRQAAVEHHLLLKWRHSADNACKLFETKDTVANSSVAPPTHIQTECWQTDTSRHNSFLFTFT